MILGGFAEPQPLARSPGQPSHHEPSTVILTEWGPHIAEHDTTTPSEARRADEITRLRRKLIEKIDECTLVNRRSTCSRPTVNARSAVVTTHQ